MKNEKKVAEPATPYPADTSQDILAEMDRMMAQMAQLRAHVAGLLARETKKDLSVREADYFGMWEDREDMQGMDSSEWLLRLRQQQWTQS